MLGKKKTVGLTPILIRDHGFKSHPRRRVQLRWDIEITCHRIQHAFIRTIIHLRLKGKISILIMGIFETPTSNFILSCEWLTVFPLRWRSQGCPFLPLLCNISLEVLSRITKGKKPRSSKNTYCKGRCINIFFYRKQDSVVDGIPKDTEEKSTTSSYTGK